ncbi:sorting nexin-14-like isoform X2 [Euwallacea fornicatus]|uniref:sorting nexin-14-like isoform X2 n=1 Tax=Euwallacea fornicatus TaxID=995702 RepID=UPI00338F87D6
MIFTNLLEILRLILDDFYVKISAAVVLIFSGSYCLFLSPFAGFTILTCYLLGYVATFLLIKYRHLITNYLEKLLTKYRVKPYAQVKLKSSCSVCDGLTCRRHNVGRSVTPWKELQISCELNQAIKHFFNKILEEFICSWHKQFTENSEFLNELKFCLKYASASLVNRVLQIDYVSVLNKKLIPQSIKHIDDYLYMQQIAKLKNVKYDGVIVEYLGSNLHPATTNRSNELAYLQHLSAELIKYLFPPYYIGCKNYTVLLRELLAGWILLPLMDAIADPNIINSLVIIAINYKTASKPPLLPEEEEFLQEFIQLESSRKPAFMMSLNKIKNSTELLYPFMQFLKKEEQVHLLQFCMDVDDFNTKLLTPDLSKKQLEGLHVQALNLYKEYLNADSFNFIGCSSEICAEFSDLIEDIYSVAKLRTSKPLYQAYEFAFNQLEAFWLPHFFHSNEFYNYICGTKITSSYNKASIKSKKYYEQSNYGAVSKISSSLGKIRGVLKAAAPIEGSLDPLESGYSEDVIFSDNLMRDLSSWKVKISTSEETQTHKIVHFCISVFHIDETTPEKKINSWSVRRKDQDFFTLKAKLVEFHGESEICDSPLPSRKAGSLVESRIPKYEEFLGKLLQKPSLRSSDLLHSFLTIEDDFTLAISTMAPNNQDIGNIYQSVAYKLRKEKGQNLDSFINTFVSSVMKQKPDKPDIAEEGTEAEASLNKDAGNPKTFKSQVFKDNFGISYKLCSGNTGNGFHPSSFSESFFYLLRHIFKINLVLLKVYVAICSIAQQLVDILISVLIEKKIKAALTQYNLTYLIKLLEGAIFNTHAPHTTEEYEKRRSRAFADIQCCPNFLNRILGGKVNDGLTELLQILQNPHYNKQLCYNLLDTILVETFPELNDA